MGLRDTRALDRVHNSSPAALELQKIPVQHWWHDERPRSDQNLPCSFALVGRRNSNAFKRSTKRLAPAMRPSRASNSLCGRQPLTQVDLARVRYGSLRLTNPASTS